MHSQNASMDNDEENRGSRMKRLTSFESSECVWTEEDSPKLKVSKIIDNDSFFLVKDADETNDKEN